MEAKLFYRCNICGNLIAMIENSGNVPHCCGQAMENLEPGTTDAPHEKHVPVITRKEKKVCVTVGEIHHPMNELHYIEWIELQTNLGSHMRRLNPGDAPSARFLICDDEKPLCAFAYCNLHGLWSAYFESE